MSDTTSHGTVKRHHAKPGDDVTEGGPTAPPVESRGHAKPAASNSIPEGVPTDDTRSATAGSPEKQHAAEAGADETQSGRGHRKD